MKTNRLRTLILVPVLLLFCAAVSVAGHQEKRTTAADVKEKAAETYEVLKDYTLQQRDEAMSAAREKMAELDVQMDELENSLDEHWQDMGVAAREKKREALKALRHERQEVSEWYGGMRHSSAEAWEDVKKGFAQSYDRMEDAFKDAARKFKKEK